MGEYCFISGMLTGAVFLFSFVYKVHDKKELPVWLYFDCMISLLVILIATVLIGLNLEGAFWFIHIINPIIVFLYWCFFCNHQNISNPALIATDIIFPLCYLFFAFILRGIWGITPFPASMIFEMGSIENVLLAMAALLVIFLILGYVLHLANWFIYKRFYERK
ncbi:hypothetical protein EDD66_1104 [Mobilisporobacter senegalensis]|uniref:FAR-17a/AIG1-like protein n=1 Tax=Mobilisporobacter senegalensis TaxID=1329262 RepID=A0A3N1XG03_9FIRM|nr:hypothetical protein [Mobilisporobacter senegalensis]ROR25654.1 hypothetical protein EDD66_1104 [Mobilisporobacter senegalensis]